MAHKENKISRNYRDCMTPDETWRRCRPGWRSKNPEDEARKRNDELLEARGELVTLITRRIKGDDIIDRQIGPVQNNYVSALPLNFIYFFDTSINPGSDPRVDPRFSVNLSTFLSDDVNARRHWTGIAADTINTPHDMFYPLVIAKRPPTSQTNYLYIGHRKQFSNISIKLFTRLISDNVYFEYSRGNNIWSPLPVLAESTPKASSLQEAGRIVFDPNFFPDWKLDYVNKDQAFWIRAKINDNTEGQAAAVLLFTEHIIQSATVWNVGDNPLYFPNDKCITIKVNGKIFNRVYDIAQLDYSQESFVIVRRDQFSQLVGLDNYENEQWGLNPFDTCESNPMDYVKELGTRDLKHTNRLREMAFLYNQLMRTRQKANSDAVLVLFTRNLRVDTSVITATYTSICPCTAYGRMQAIRDGQQPDDSSCGACYGTEFLNGYERFVNPDREDGKILMSFPAAPFDMPLDENGLGVTHELTTARMSWTPRIFVRDIIVRYDELNQETLRYIVMTRTDSIGRRGVLLHQEMVLQALDRDKVEYRIEVPDLPLAPSQAQVLQSLGILVPDDPGLTKCEELRLDKGKKNCRPVRDRRSE